ncbi:MAG: hypothetical protein ACREIC_03125, partial [Limisphaerales bacterium]
MGIKAFAKKIATVVVFRKRTQAVAPPVLLDAVRFPYGPFRFKARLSVGMDYTILASSNLSNWKSIAGGIAPTEEVEHVDSDAANFGCRFYRVLTAEIYSINIIGYAAVGLPPGFSLIANPFDAPGRTVGGSFSGWPDGTTLHKYD